MAVIEQLPAMNIIDGFRGTLDFYVLCRGQKKKTVVVRSWPRFRRSNMSAASVAAQTPFAAAAAAVAQADADVQKLYAAMAEDTTYTWKDVAISLYIKGDYIYNESVL
jgi:hypothetical protein